MIRHASDSQIDDLYLFAHQDDEFSAVHLIEHGVRDQRSQLFVFLTDGRVAGGVDSEVRNRETIAALGALGIGEEQIVFAGTTYGLPDGALFRHLPRALNCLNEIVGKRPIDRVVLPAWEGGHPDHDAVHLTGLAFACQRNRVERCVQLPFYRGQKGFPGITLFSPLEANGAPVTYNRTVSEIVSHLALSRFYPTQARHFAGILPLTILHFLTGSRLYSQPVERGRVLERPAAKVKYEGRHRIGFSEFQEHTKDFIDVEIIGDGHQ
ncbi:MAG: PIG-L family deacetylase [Pseudomonadota bacterium]